MRASNRRNARAAVTALVLLAVVGAAPVYGDHRYGFGLAFGGPYLGFGGYGGGLYLGTGGYGGGLYLGAGGYGGGLSLGLGGNSGGVIVGVGGHGGVPYSYLVPGVTAGGVTTAPVVSAPPYYGTIVAPVPPVAAPGYSLQPTAPRVILPGRSRAADTFSAERVNDDILRLAWRDDGSGVREVTLFLADAGRNVLAQQSVRTAPFTALFELAPGTAYVGVTRHYADGMETTTVMPAPTTALRSETETPLR